MKLLFIKWDDVLVEAILGKHLPPIPSPGALDFSLNKYNVSKTLDSAFDMTFSCPPFTNS
jgi:hypothetical protein